MAKKDPETLFQHKRAVFLERAQKALPGVTEADFSGNPQLSIRVNTLKDDTAYPHPIPWAPSCYWLDGDKQAVTHSDEFINGAIYLQNAASFIPPIILDPQPHETILDMCAAPGGKSSHIAALAHNQAELWVNDNSRPRQAKMQANFRRLGIQPHANTLFNINRLSKELPHEYFDKILLDAPCSGEGMLDINDRKDFTYWSVAQIKRLSSLQKHAISIAWELLKPGGRLVYSTCTIAPEENEVVIDYLLKKNADASLEPIEICPNNARPALTSWNGKTFTHSLQSCLRLAPSPRIEAFFVASIKKGA